MSDTPSDPTILDRAYGDGKLAGFLGLETSVDCPFGRDRMGQRIAWLDGFAMGAWQSASKADAARPDEDAPRVADDPGSGEAIMNIAMAHLLRLSKCAGRREKKAGELAAALQAVAKFIYLAGLSETRP